MSDLIADGRADGTAQAARRDDDGECRATVR